MDNLMDSIQPGKPRSTSCGVKPLEIGAGVVQQFGEEIHNLITVPSSEGGSSFTALLELPANQAVELLVHSPETAEMTSEKLAGTELHTPYYHFPPPIFPSDTALVDRASKFSVFAGNSPDPNSVLSNSGSKSLPLLKQEPLDSESNLNSSPAVSNPTVNQKTRKRKENEKKVIGSGKKSKKSANDTSEDEKLPYVHVRARRGQATDSHSLAERARREKINARMKLLQELVPGCNKISGTAMVLDEIINHVQSLQRQVEFLSMRLAAVNPRTDFNFDSLFAAESGSHVESNFQGMVMPSMLPEGQNSGNRSQYQQLWHFEGFHQQPVWGRDEDNSSFITPENSLLTYDSSANSASLHPNQLKMEL